MRVGVELSARSSSSLSVCLSLYIGLYVCLSLNVCMRLCPSVCLFLSVCLSLSICLYVSLYVCMCMSACFVFMYVCLCVYVSFVSVCLFKYVHEHLMELLLGIGTHNASYIMDPGTVWFVCNQLLKYILGYLLLTGSRLRDVCFVLHFLTECPMQTYKPQTGNSQCIVCPANSNTTRNGSTGCECTDGFSRQAFDSVNASCTSRTGLITASS